MYRRLICLTALALLLGWAGPAAWGQENQLENPEFDEDFDFWALYGGAGFTVEVVRSVRLSGLNSVLIDITDPTVASIGIQQGGLDFVQGQTYPVGLTAKADVERGMVILIQLQKPEGPTVWNDIFMEHVTLTTEPQTFVFEYTHNDETMADHPSWVARIHLILRGQWSAVAGSDLVSKVWVDRVHVGEQPPLMESIIRQAHDPVPEDGATIDQTATILNWQPGDFAVSHNVYLGESSDEVSEGLAGPTATADERLIVGIAPAYPTGFTPGQTYYWRVDEVNDVHPESPWEGPVWSFLVRPETAWRPDPPDGARFVDANQDLSWEPGMGVLFHTVYFGQSYEEVSTATSGGWMIADSQQDPGLMEPNTTYYWRVDEFAGTATHTGDVWSFTTAAPGTGLRAEYFNNRDLSGDPVLTRIDSNIDFDWGSGDVPGENSPDESINVDDFSARWTGELEVDLTDTYVFSITADNGFRLWFDGRLIIDHWDNSDTSTHQSEPIPLVAGQTYPLLMEYYEGTGTAIAQLFWESAVQNRTDARVRQIVPSGSLGPPLKAHSPEPANGAVDTAWSLDLAWTAGDRAAQHHVYFGIDPEAVAGADTATADVYRGRQGWATYNPGALDWGQTYYWRVDEEQADGTVRQGGLWSFTTADFIVVDDFEAYTDDSPDRIFQTWIDGFGYTDPQDVPGNGTGSTVGNVEPPFAEQSIIHGGRQSMPMEYDNTFPPYYSEAERTWATPQDWTLGGVDTLTLYVRGHSTNDADPVYVVIEDSTGGIGVVAHPDPVVVTSILWVEWKVPLTDFTSAGVNVARVKKMYIGVGDRSNSLPGGAGKLYIDDIRATQ